MLSQFKDVLLGLNLYMHVMINFNRYASISDMITSPGWLTLKQRQETFSTIMVYKIVNNLVAIATCGH